MTRWQRKDRHDVWQVTFAGGAIETFPNGDSLKVRVLQDIAA